MKRNFVKVEGCMTILWLAAGLFAQSADLHSLGEGQFLANVRQLTFEGRRSGEGYFSPDGKALIYNSEGKLYRFDLETNKPTLIDTGDVQKNNNDHVLSFDGKMLGISRATLYRKLKRYNIGPRQALGPPPTSQALQ